MEIWFFSLHFEHEKSSKVYPLDAEWKTASSDICFIVFGCEYSWTPVEPKRHTVSNRLYLTKNASTIDSFIFYPIILYHFTRHMMGKKAMYAFKKRIYRWWEKSFSHISVVHLYKIWEKTDHIYSFEQQKIKTNIIFGISVPKYIENSIFYF